MDGRVERGQGLKIKCAFFLRVKKPCLDGRSMRDCIVSRSIYSTWK